MNRLDEGRSVVELEGAMVYDTMSQKKTGVGGEERAICLLYNNQLYTDTLLKKLVRIDQISLDVYVFSVNAVCTCRNVEK